MRRRAYCRFLPAPTARGLVAAFSQIPPWRRIFSLFAGGVLAGIVLLFAAKKIKKSPTPYMEAVSIGNGYIPVRANLLRSLAAIITIGSGTSIGREGPLVQTVAVFASVVGRRLRLSTPRLRLLIACSAAGAMASVFHAPARRGAFCLRDCNRGYVYGDYRAPNGGELHELSCNVRNLKPRATIRNF